VLLLLVAGAGVTVAIGSIGAKGVVVNVAVAAIGCAQSVVSSNDSLVLECGIAVNILCGVAGRGISLFFRSPVVLLSTFANCVRSSNEMLLYL